MLQHNIGRYYTDTHLVPDLGQEGLRWYELFVIVLLKTQNLLPRIELNPAPSSPSQWHLPSLFRLILKAMSVDAGAEHIGGGDIDVNNEISPLVASCYVADPSRTKYCTAHLSCHPIPIVPLLYLRPSHHVHRNANQGKL
jgi:hypothetical protein